MLESIVVIGVIGAFFTATIVYISKKHTEQLLRLTHNEEKVVRALAKQAQELKRLKKSLVAGARAKRESPEKNKHVISEKTVKELLLDLEDEGVLQKNSNRDAKDIIIIQEFVHHADPPVSPGDEDMSVILDEARELVKTTGIAAPHLLESQLRIPQDIAEQLLDRLEEEGIVGPPDGSSHRNVYIRE